MSPVASERDDSWAAEGFTEEVTSQHSVKDKRCGRLLIWSFDGVYDSGDQREIPSKMAKFSL